jgi:hypothetical protein
MQLSTLRNELTKIERAITVCDNAHYADLLDDLMAQRAAMHRLAAHLVPRSAADAAFLHDLVDELLEFVDDEQEATAERAEALEAISRANEALRAYMVGV